ncbi:MAG: carbohydrate kinase family protein [Anaerolineaceae bacterium]|nr:carbohydrate kinase family protein [Anaerolineaceae bacterium]
MAKILVSGLINIETTLKIEEFPINYFPVTYPFFGIRSTVSGVGYNLAKALTTLSNKIDFLSIIGNDIYQPMILNELKALNISSEYIQPDISETAQSVILYDPDGKRQIYTDLKDIQEKTYPIEPFKKALEDSDLCVLCNINFSRSLLEITKQAGKLIATDVHAISSLEDEYNQDFMANADILFMSHENLPVSPEEWACAIWRKFNTPIIVVGMGSEGALLGIRKEGILTRFPAVKTRRIVNTIGAGDALFSAFIHTYLETQNPILAIQKAITFASYKIGSIGAAEGFLTARELDQLFT